jgi:quinol monooxygenase YgiN
MTDVLNRWQFGKRLAADTAVALAGGDTAIASRATEQVSEESHWETVAPGTWKMTVGVPEAITPVSSRLVPASIEAMRRMAVVPAPVIGLPISTIGPRGISLVMPLAAHEQIYGFGLRRSHPRGGMTWRYDRKRGASPMLIVHVHVRVKPESVADFRIATAENARCSVQEPGIARFDVVEQQDDATRFVLIEVYRTPEAATAHKETAHYAKWRDAVAPMMAEPRQSTRYNAVFPDLQDW